MTTRKSSKTVNSKSGKGDSKSDKSEILFITNSPVSHGVGFQQHSDNGGGGALSRKVNEVKKDWDTMMGQLNEIIAVTEKTTSTGHYQMDEIAVKLGFTAKGKIAFIAEAGVEASIEVKFKRKEK